MARLMSVALTEDAVREQRKTVTRRLGWWTDKNGRRLLRPGDQLTLCRKVMGRKPGEPVVRIAEVEVVDMARQELCIDNTGRDAELEGFPDWTWVRFVEFFCAEMRVTPTTPVTRIEFRYLSPIEEVAL